MTLTLRDRGVCAFVVERREEDDPRPGGDGGRHGSGSGGVEPIPLGGYAGGAAAEGSLPSCSGQAFSRSGRQVHRGCEGAYRRDMRHITPSRQILRVTDPSMPDVRSRVEW
jgi:hypothetical protein